MKCSKGDSSVQYTLLACTSFCHLRMKIWKMIAGMKLIQKLLPFYHFFMSSAFLIGFLIVFSFFSILLCISLHNFNPLKYSPAYIHNLVRLATLTLLRGRLFSALDMDEGILPLPGYIYNPRPFRPPFFFCI